MFSLKMVQEHVSMLFYRHGLLCASHPFAIISLVCTIVMFMWLVSTCCNIFVYQQHFFCFNMFVIFFISSCLLCALTAVAL